MTSRTWRSAQHRQQRVGERCVRSAGAGAVAAGRTAANRSPGRASCSNSILPVQYNRTGTGLLVGRSCSQAGFRRRPAPLAGNREEDQQNQVHLRQRRTDGWRRCGCFRGAHDQDGAVQIRGEVQAGDGERNPCCSLSRLWVSTALESDQPVAMHRVPMCWSLPPQAAHGRFALDCGGAFWSEGRQAQLGPDGRRDEHTSLPE